MKGGQLDLLSHRGLSETQLGQEECFQEVTDGWEKTQTENTSGAGDRDETPGPFP